MGEHRKRKHRAEEAAGAAKRKVGEESGDLGLRAEGTYDESKAKANRAVDSTTDKAKNAKDDLAEKARRAFSRDQ